MASRWDRRTTAQQSKAANAAFTAQCTERLARYSPYWRETVRGAGIRLADLHGLADLPSIPAVGERDLCPDGTSSGAAKLVLQAGEAGFAVHADGPNFRRALRERLTSPTRYRRTVDAAVRPVAYHLGGLAFRFPIASTRGDLDLVARAGARMWQVLGLTDADVLVSALPGGGSLPGFALPYAAIGAGAPAAHGGISSAADALDALPATVVAVRDAAMLDALLARRGDVLPASVRTILVTGSDDGVAELAGGATVLRVWGPAESRWLWAECREGGRATGFHTYPDLEVLETVNPATGDTVPGSGELVVTHLSTYGSALVRWRTGATHSGLRAEPCPGCGRTVPRVAPDVAPGALVVGADVGGARALLDLRAVAGALAGRGDLAGWALTVTDVPSGVHVDHPTGAGRVVAARIAPTDLANAADAAVAAYADIESVAGSGPTQVVLDPAVRGRAELVGA